MRSNIAEYSSFVAQLFCGNLQTDFYSFEIRSMATDWNQKATSLSPPAATNSAVADDYFVANVDMVRRTLNGKGPHITSSSAPGMRIVYNLPARHALSFLDHSSSQPGRGVYLNRTDVNRVIGTPLPKSSLRDRVDQAVCAAANALRSSLTPQTAYYGAMELNGTGIRYFGDVCLVLAPNDDNPVMLIRNSYDLSVPPVVNNLLPLAPAGQDSAAARIAKEWIGKWKNDACDMAIIKVMTHAAPTERRMTVGQVSEAVLEDEDYIEIVRSKTFRPSDIEEIRLTAEDAALEARIADRIRVGGAPSSADMLWRFRRRWVDYAARQARLATRTVTSTGRARS